MTLEEMKFSLSLTNRGSRRGVALVAQRLSNGEVLWSTLLEAHDDHANVPTSVQVARSPEGMVVTLENGHQYWLSLTEGKILWRKPDLRPAQADQIFALVEKLQAMKGWDARQVGELTRCRLTRQGKRSGGAMSIFAGVPSSSDVFWSRVELRLGTTPGALGGIVSLTLTEPYVLDRVMATERYGQGAVLPSVACGPASDPIGMVADPAYIEYRTTHGFVRWSLTPDLSQVCAISIDHWKVAE
jgi:hypothetical protein